LITDLSRARVPIALGQFLAPRIPVTVHRIEPSAGFSMLRCRASGASVGVLARQPMPAVPRSRYCAVVSRRSLIRAALPRRERR